MADAENFAVNLHYKQTIAAALTGIFDAKQAAQFIRTQGISISNPDGSYTSLNDPKAVITEDSVKQIRIEVDGKPHFFKRVNRQEATDTDPPAISWVETDPQGHLPKESKGQLWCCYQGLTDIPFMNTPQTRAMHDVGDGELDRQMQGVPKFLANSVEMAGGKEHVVTNIAVHSLGTPDAIMSQLCCDMAGLQAQTIVLEGAGAKLITDRLIEAFSKPVTDPSNKPIDNMGVEEKNRELAARLFKELPNPDHLPPAQLQSKAVAYLTAYKHSDSQVISFDREITFSENGEVHYTHTAQLKILDSQRDGATPADNKKVRDQNAGIIMNGRNDVLDPQNAGVGAQTFHVMSQASTAVPGFIPNPDWRHQDVNIYNGLQHNDMQITAEELHKISEQLKALHQKNDTKIAPQEELQAIIIKLRAADVKPTTSETPGPGSTAQVKDKRPDIHSK